MSSQEIDCGKLTHINTKQMVFRITTKCIYICMYTYKHLHVESGDSSR